MGKLGVFLSLHPQQVCSLLAVVEGVKPSAIVESVELGFWPEFLSAVKSWGLAVAYETRSGYVVLTPSGEAFLIPGNVLARDSGELDLSSALKRSVVSAEPVSESGLDVHNVYVSRDLETLLELVSLHSSPDKRGDMVRRLGLLLGYPKCCVDEYVSRGAVDTWYDYFSSLISSGMCEEVPLELWAVYHAPCSPKCRETLRLGREYLEAVERFSSTLYRRVMEGLSSNHLLYSVGRRFIEYREIDAPIPHAFYELAFKLLGEPRVTAGLVLRPYVYFEWMEEPYRLVFTKRIEGLKYVAYSPGHGLLVVDEDLEVLAYVTVKALGIPDRYSSILFRVYRSRTEPLNG